MFESSKPNRKQSHLQWTYLKCQPKHKSRCWVCGPLIGVETHYVNRSVPCRKSLTGGIISCKYDHEIFKTKWIGYLPTFSETGKREVVGLGVDSEELASALCYGQPIAITKAHWKEAPLQIVNTQWTSIACPFLGDKREAQDIRPWLLQLWADEELVGHFGMIPKKVIMAGSNQTKKQSREEPEKELELAQQLLRKRFITEWPDGDLRDLDGDPAKPKAQRNGKTTH